MSLVSSQIQSLTTAETPEDITVQSYSLPSFTCALSFAHQTIDSREHQSDCLLDPLLTSLLPAACGLGREGLYSLVTSMR